MNRLLKCRLVKITWQGIREIEELDLALKPGINIIQIRNGYGKTTTLYLLRCIFTGTLPPVEQFPRYKRQFGGRRDESRFTVDLEIENSLGEMKPWTVSLVCNHKDKQVEFETSSPVIGGCEPGWKLPIEFRSKFEKRDRFAELFLFNGEKAEELCQEQGHAQIENAIREITGLHHVYTHTEARESGIVKLLDDELKAQAVNNADDAHERWQSWKEELEAHIKSVEEECAVEKAHVDKLEQEIRALEVKVRDLESSRSIDAQIEKHRDKINELQTNLTATTGSLLNALSNPANSASSVWSEVQEFHTSLLNARIPEGVGKSFFIDILRHPACICGTPWNAKMRKSVETCRNNYLGDEILGIVKTMQTQVRDSRSTANLSELVDQINNLRMQIASQGQEIENLRGNVDEEARDQLKLLNTQLINKREKKRKIQEFLDEVNETDSAVIRGNRWEGSALNASGEPAIRPHNFKSCKNLFTLQRVKNALKQKLLSNKTLRELDRGVTAARETYAKALERVMQSLRQRLENRTNELLTAMPGTGGGISVRFTADGLRFVNEYEEQSTANIGAILSGSYSFIAAMAELGSVEVPLVVDSPVTGLDLSTAEAWCVEIWPCFKQLIAFITPAERTTIEKRIAAKNRLYGSDVWRVTIHRRDEDRGGGNQTGPMVLNLEQGWFKSYQAEDQPEGLQ